MVPARLDCPSQLTASSPASARFYPRLGKTEAQHFHDSLDMSYFGRFLNFWYAGFAALTGHVNIKLSSWDLLLFNCP
jgi:hypothetical protein